MTKRFMFELCKKCPNADGTVSYSNWHYCQNKHNPKEFTVIRHFPHYGGPEEIAVEVPVWCPHKKEEI